MSLITKLFEKNWSLGIGLKKFFNMKYKCIRQKTHVSYLMLQVICGGVSDLVEIGLGFESIYI